MDRPCFFFFGLFAVMGGQSDISCRFCRFGRHFGYVDREDPADVMTSDPPANQPNRDRCRVMYGLADKPKSPTTLIQVYTYDCQPSIRSISHLLE